MNINRRNFIKYLSVAAFPASFFTSFPLFRTPPLKAPSSVIPGRVVIIRRPDNFISRETVSSDSLFKLIGEGICRLTGAASAGDALRALFSSSEKIGIKVNSMGGKSICTHAPLAYAVARHLAAIGISPGNIILWDRLTSELEKGGYTIQKGGNAVQCFGTDNSYEHEISTSGSIGSCFSRILTADCDALINIPVLKDHDLSGVSLGLKNFYGAIHNPNKYHDSGCDPYIADLNAHPLIKNRLRLVIIDGLTAQYNGGPAFKPQWSFPYGGIIMSGDPVAADAAGSQIIEEHRKLHGQPSLLEAGRSPVHIQTAAQRGLGICDLKKIEKIFL